MTRVCRQLLALLVSLGAAMPVSAQVTSRKSSQEAMTLDLDSAVIKRLASLEDLVADAQWDALATLLMQTQAEKPDKLIPVSEGWYVSVLRYCQCQAALLPPPGLSAYRRQVDAAAKRSLEDADRQLMFARLAQRAAWLKIVRQQFASSFADDALSRIAEQSFEDGDFATARTYWEMLLPPPGPLRSAAGLGLLRYPDSSADAAQIRAQLLLCSLFRGDRTRAATELTALRTLHGNAVGRLAGREGSLVDLSPSLAESTHAEPSRRASTLLVDRPLWSVVLPSPTGQAEGAIAASDAEDCFPVVAGDTLFVSNGESIFAFDALTGHARWSERPATDKNPQAAIIHSLADPIAPKLPIRGRPIHSLTVRGDRLYARLGTPITAKAKDETNAHSELVGLDIGQAEGKLVWRVAAEEIESEDPLTEGSPWCFDGCPVADSERVFVVLRRSLPQQQINVACFDAATTRLLWNRKLGVTVVSADETANSTSHLQLTLAEDSVFLTTDAGTIAALDAHDGTIRWLRTYPSDAILAQRDRRPGHTSAVYQEGVLYSAPLDSNILMAIHAESGLLLWRREWPDPIQYVLGVSHSTLVVQGRSLWGVELATGEPAWPLRQVGHVDPEGHSCGRGALVGNNVWWPNQEQLLVVAADSGDIKRRLELREAIQVLGGHLSISESSVIISRGNQLTVLGAGR